jgi:glucose/arabinose dehydrogenase
MAWAPDGTMLVTMRHEGRILRIGSGESDYLVGEGAEWLRDNGVKSGEGGVLGIALLPSNPNVVYVYITRADGNAVVRMLRFGQTLGAPTDVVTGIPKAGNHNGGRIRFGPDGHLYITTGDAGNTALSQDLNSLAGKILRVVADGTEADGSVPEDNPFGTLVWSYGHRNPQGLDWAADGRMFAAELGQNTLDELNVIEPGNNYGWPIKEAMVGAPAGTAAGATVEGYTYPVAWWPTSKASPSGITVTDEAVYVAALRGQRVWRVPLTPDGVGTSHVLLNDLGRIRLIQEGPHGNLYVLTSNGKGADKIVRIVVRETEN